jgi:4-amino-4-deoxy-L-arabinose transferase-like glycosyltransferase
MKIKLEYIAIIAIIVLTSYYALKNSTLPIAFGDEGYHLAMSKWLAQNQIVPRYDPFVNSGIQHSKTLYPLLFHSIMGFIFLFLGEFGLKIMPAIFAGLTSLVILVFSKEFDKTGVGGLIASVAFLMTPSVVLYSFLGYTDTLLALLTTLSAYFIFKSFEPEATKNQVFLAGIFSGLAMLTKISAAVIFLILIFCFVLNKFQKKKTFLMILIIPLILISSLVIRNIVLFGEPCYYFYAIKQLPFCNSWYVFDKEVPQPTLQFAATGEGTTILEFGLTNFANFAFGWAITFLLIFGAITVLVKKPKYWKFSGIWAMAFLIIPLLMFSIGLGRAEEAARVVLPAVAPIVIVSGVFVKELYDNIPKNKILSATIIILIISSMWVFAQNKMTVITGVPGVSNGVKQFAPSFFDACKWIKQNTPKDSILFTLQEHPAYYNCDRKFMWDIVGLEEVLLSGNDNIYTYLKLHEFDYVFVQYFSLSSTPTSKSYSFSFLNYIIEHPEKFKTVFDNSDVYGNSGSAVFQIL